VYSLFKAYLQFEKYTVSFFKLHLLDEAFYAQFLTSSYADIEPVLKLKSSLE